MGEKNRNGNAIPKATFPRRAQFRRVIAPFKKKGKWVFQKNGNKGSTKWEGRTWYPRVNKGLKTHI